MDGGSSASIRSSTTAWSRRSAIGDSTVSGGTPFRIRGTLVYLGGGPSYDRIAAVAFGDGDLVIITPASEQAMRPEELQALPYDAVASRPSTRTPYPCVD